MDKASNQLVNDTEETSVKSEFHDDVKPPIEQLFINIKEERTDLLDEWESESYNQMQMKTEIDNVDEPLIQERAVEEKCKDKFSARKDCNVKVSRLKQPKPHKCDTCAKTFTQKVHLTEHFKIHKGLKPHKCQTCGKCFTRKGYLRQHIQIHTGVKPYQCDECGKCFLRKDDLTRHVNMHTGIKAHQCQTCGKHFTQKSHLLTHMHNIHAKA